MGPRYTASRVSSGGLGWFRRLNRHFWRQFRGQSSGATIIEYILIGGLCAIGIITAYRRYRAYSTVVTRNEAKIVATLDSMEPEAIIAGLGGFDRVDDECDPTLGCMIPGVECFAAGTLVATDRGDRPIETIVAGDLVWSRDASTHRKELKPVEQVFVKRAATVIELELLGTAMTERVTVTPEHPFWVEDEGWVPAVALGGAPLWSPGAPLSAHSLATRASPATVYNLQVQDFHTYFVGRSHALVHNQDCDDFDPQEDCIDAVLSLPHSRYRHPSRRAELEALCRSGEYRFNPRTGRLRNINSGTFPDPVSEPCLQGTPQTHTATSPAFDAERDRLLRERAAAHCAEPPDVPAQTSVSQSLGEMAAEDYGNRTFSASEGWERIDVSATGAGAHAYDLVYIRTNPQTGQREVAVIEAKGGAGELGTRWGSDESGNRTNQRVEQGTIEYAETIANVMRNSGDPSRIAAGQQILDAIHDGNMRYVLVHQPVGSVNCDTDPPTYRDRDIEVSEFAVYPEDRQDHGC